MRRASRFPGSVALVLLLSLAMLIGLGPGCAAAPEARDGPVAVTAFANRQVAELSPDDVVHVLRRAGLSDEEILLVGPDVRNALASSGGARIQMGVTVDTMIAVDGPRVHVSSRRTGSFIYPLERPAPVLIVPPADEPPLKVD